MKLSIFNMVGMLAAGLIGAALHKDPMIIVFGLCGATGWALDALHEYRKSK